MILIFIGGITFVFFSVAYSSILPQLYSKEKDLHKGNSRLYLSQSTSQFLGPIIAGPLISFFGVIITVFINAFSFLVSVFCLSSIKLENEEKSKIKKEKGWLLKEMKEGLVFVIKHPQIEPVISCGLVYIFGLSIIESVLVLYCHDVLKLSTIMIGIVIGSSAIGLPLGNIFLLSF